MLENAHSRQFWGVFLGVRGLILNVVRYCRDP